MTSPATLPRWTRANLIHAGHCPLTGGEPGSADRPGPPCRRSCPSSGPRWGSSRLSGSASRPARTCCGRFRPATSTPSLPPGLGTGSSRASTAQPGGGPPPAPTTVRRATNAPAPHDADPPALPDLTSSRSAVSTPVVNTPAMRRPGRSAHPLSDPPPVPASKTGACWWGPIVQLHRCRASPHLCVYRMQARHLHSDRASPAAGGHGDVGCTRGAGVQRAI